LNIPRLPRRLNEMGVNPNAILELWPPPESNIEAAIQREDAWTALSIDYLRTLIPG
jgi:hypothetical protein